MKTLKTRKDLLILESDLNRVLLVAELGALKQEIHRLTGPALAAGPLAARAFGIVSSITGVFSFFRRGKPEKPARFPAVSMLVRCLRAGMGLWSGWRDLSKAPGREHDD